MPMQSAASPLPAPCQFPEHDVGEGAGETDDFRRLPPLRPLGALASDEPRLLVVGEHAPTRALQSCLRRSPFVVEQASTLDGALEVVARFDREVALVLSPEIGGMAQDEAVRECRGSLEAATLPVIPVVPDPVSDAEARELLDVGANGVAAWPEDAALLAEWITLLLRRDPHRAPYTDADRCLARSVAAKIEVALGGPVPVEAADGVVAISPSARRPEAAAVLATSVPGVETVVVAPELPPVAG